MLIRTQAIVLNQFRYTDNSIIAHVLTSTHGRISLMIRGGRSKRSVGKHVYFQPLFLLDIEADYKENRDIQSLRNVIVGNPLHNISSDIRKQSIALFLAEVLQKSVKAQQPDQELFQYVYHSIMLFEHMTKGSSIFHHYFLVQLTKYLGFFPGNNHSESLPLLDTEAGLFVGLNEINPACLTEEESRLIAFFIRLSADEIPLMQISHQKKTLCMESILSYYSKHIPGFSNLKSYDILKDVFA